MKVRSGKGVFAGVFELLARVVLRRPWAVIGAWLLLVVALSVAVPPLMKLASDRNQELLPSNSAVMAATRDMTAAFHEPGILNIALVVLTDENGLTKADEDVSGPWSTACTATRPTS
ncbi:RND family transporter [Mycolicibacterium aubagnense]